MKYKEFSEMKTGYLLQRYYLMRRLYVVDEDFQTIVCELKKRGRLPTTHDTWIKMLDK